MVKRRSTIWLLVVTGMCASACGVRSHTWHEEVQLSDERIIVVERETIVEPGGDEWAHNRGGMKPREFRIRFAAPDRTAQTIEWKSVRKTPQGWPEKPLVLDIEGGQAIVFASVYISDGCEVYLKYRYQDSAWVEQALPEEFVQRPTNLSIRDGTNMPTFVTLSDKRKGNAEPGYRPALRNIGPRRKICG